MKKLFGRFGRSIHRHAKVWITAIVLITIFLTFGLPKIQMKMGNDVFVSPGRAIYQNSQTYQKHFGGDSLYVLLNGPRKNILNHKTMQDIARFSHKANHVKNIKNTTSVVNLVNSELKNKQSSQANMSNVNRAKLKKDLLSSMSKAQKAKLAKQAQASLTSAQKAQIQQYTLTILTPAQKQKMQALQQAAMAQAMQKTGGNQQMAQMAVASASQSPAGKQKQQAMVAKALNSGQKAKIKAYAMTILNPAQQKALQGSAAKSIPKVQNMSTPLLRDIFLDKNGNIQKPLKLLFPRNGRHALMVLNTSSKSSDMSVDVQLSNDVKNAMKKTHFNSGVTTKLAGTPHILGQVNAEVIKNMGIMLIFAVILMVLILALVFPVRRRILPLLFVLICLDDTFGIMGWVGLPLTLATMATLPIIIGLGTDFGVQFLNRYEEEFKKRHDSTKSIEVSIENMGPAVGIALIVMTLSFLTMFLSKAPLMQKFGMTLAIGVVISYFIEMIMIFGTVSLRDAKMTDRKVPKNKSKVTPLSRLLARYAGFVMRHAWPVLIIGLILGAVGFSTEPKIGVDTQLTHMIPQNMSSLVNTRYLQHKIGSTMYITYLVKDHHVTNPKDMQRLYNLGQHEEHKYTNVKGVTSVATTYKKSNGKFTASQSKINSTINKLPKSVRQTLINKPHTYATLQFKVNQNSPSKDQLHLMNNISHDLRNEKGMTIRSAGTQNMMFQGIKNMTANRDLIIVVGLLIIFVVLFLVYRNWRLAIFPIVPIMIVLGLSPLTLFLMHTSYNPLTVSLSALVLGIGIEFTILIMERYREELAKGNGSETAITRAISYVGQAITASGLTVIGGFVAIMFSSFPVLKSFGMITVLDTAYALISALTILPAFMYVLRKRYHKGSIKKNHFE